MASIKHIIFLLVLLFASHAGNLVYAENLQLDREQWEKQTQKLDYSENYKDINPPENKNKGNVNWPLIGNIILYTVLIGIVVALLVWIVRSRVVFNENVKPIELDLDSPELEKQIMEVDLDQLLNRALGYSDFRSAIRIQYLQMIKQLHSLNMIEWSAEKTNGQYLNELRTRDFFPDFRQLTLQYELAWFSNQHIEQYHYDFFTRSYTSIQPKISSNEKN